MDFKSCIHAWLNKHWLPLADTSWALSSSCRRTSARRTFCPAEVLVARLRIIVLMLILDMLSGQYLTAIPSPVHGEYPHKAGTKNELM